MKKLNLISITLLTLGLYLGIANPNQAQTNPKETAQLAQSQTPEATEADRLIREGINLFRQQTKESLLQALEKWQQALRLYQNIGNKSGQAITLLRIGRVYNNLGEKQKALEYYNQSLALFRAVGNKAGEAATFHNLGSVYNDLGDKQRALEYYNQSLPLSRAVGDKAGEAATLSNLGGVYESLGEKQKALEYYNQSLSLSRAVGDKDWEAVTLNNLGSVYDFLGEKQKALEYYNQSLPLRRAVGDKAGEAATLYNVAYSEKSRGNLTASLQNIQAAVAILEELRSKIVSPELRQTYFATVQDYYQFYVNLLMELHQQNPSQDYDKTAFGVSERQKARTLLELLREANADIRQGVSPQLLAQETKLRLQLDTLEKNRIQLLSGKYSEAEKETLDKQLETLITQYRDIQTQIRQNSPKYAAITQPQPLTLEGVQKQVLDKDTLLLQYSLGEEKSYLWAVTKEGMTSYQLPPKKEIETAALALNNIINADKNRPKSVTDERYVQEYVKAANKLSNLILTPVTDKLNKKRIVIVGDSVLNYVPFAALTLPNSEQQQLNPFINNYEITYLPSSSSLAIIRDEIKNRKPAPKALAVFADPVFGGADDDRVAIARKKTIENNKTDDLSLLALNRATREFDDLKTIKRLKGTRKEAESILQLMPKSETASVFDFGANLEQLQHFSLNQYRIFHLATHGFANDKAPELSGIILSLVDQEGKPINGYLRFYEIFNLNIPAELVVLSACQTGLGTDVGGEGLVGLTRGFMYAGAPRLVVSLWKVSDEATSELMTRFYRHLLDKGLTPAQALRKAQLEMVTETQWKTPYYWAAFTLQGEWN